LCDEIAPAPVLLSSSFHFTLHSFCDQSAGSAGDAV
jgi:hypothetical protein